MGMIVPYPFLPLNCTSLYGAGSHLHTGSLHPRGKPRINVVLFLALLPLLLRQRSQVCLANYQLLRGGACLQAVEPLHFSEVVTVHFVVCDSGR